MLSNWEIVSDLGKVAILRTNIYLKPSWVMLSSYRLSLVGLSGLPRCSFVARDQRPRQSPGGRTTASTRYRGGRGVTQYSCQRTLFTPLPR